jgi:hypothetical protein
MRASWRKGRGDDDRGVPRSSQMIPGRVPAFGRLRLGPRESLQ